MIYLTLAWEFFKIGLFTVGGGLATLPFLYDLAARYDWFTPSQVGDMVAVAECTPGPVAINMATYGGVQAAGVPGGVIATFFLVLPSVLLSLLVCTVLARFAQGPGFQRLFQGLRPAVAGLLSSIALSMVLLALLGVSGWGQAAVFNWKTCVLLAIFLPAVFLLKKHPILYIAVGAVAGVLLRL